MGFPFYRGLGEAPHRDEPAVLPRSCRTQLIEPEKYLADPGLVDACNVALLLGQPLLLTGEPGTGKTLFAYSLAYELGFDDPLKFETKSTSAARDLFYTYDALKRFQDAQSGVIRDSLEYLTYQALGIAILQTREKIEIEQFLPSNFNHCGKKRSVVLIDEIDKASRDFPNDILNELDQLYFRVSEMGNFKIEADSDYQPIIIITSNSEKNLPDAFLRRCVYYNIPFPNRDRLSKIVQNRLGLYSTGNNSFLDDALELFCELRTPKSGLRKKPATAELLGWILTLQGVVRDGENPLSDPMLPLRTLSGLVKTAEDQEKATELVRQWMENRKLRSKNG